MAHGIVRLDNMSGTTDGSLLKSVNFYTDATTKGAIDNGNIVEIGDRIAGEREIHKATAPTASTALKKIGLVAAPEVIRDESRRFGLGDFENKADEDVRVYRLHAGDVFSVTGDCLSTTTSVSSGWFATVGASTKIVPLSTTTSSTVVIGKITEIETVGADTYYVIEVDL